MTRKEVILPATIMSRRKMGWEIGIIKSSILEEGQNHLLKDARSRKDS